MTWTVVEKLSEQQNEYSHHTRVHMGLGLFSLGVFFCKNIENPGETMETKIVMQYVQPSIDSACGTGVMWT